LKRLRGNRILGIALLQDRFCVAELATNGNGKRKLLNAFDFVFPEKIGLETPAELGRAFAQHLRKHRIGAREVAIGLPAKSFVTRRKEVPPSTPEVAAASLRLQAEAEFASEQESLAIDYAGQADPSQPSTVLLVAASRSQVSACQAVMKSAGLRVRSITSTGMSLAWLSADRSNRCAFVHLQRHGAELVIHRNGSPALLSHLPLPENSDPAPLIASEMRRAMAGVPGQGQTSLVICSNSLTDPKAPEALRERLSLPMSTTDLAQYVHSDGIDLQHFAPAVAVGLAVLSEAPAIVNLVDSRLAPPAPRSNRRPLMWAGAVLLALLIAGLVAVTDLNSRQSELTEMRQRLAEMKDDIEDAEQRVNRLSVARSWVPSSAKFLGCLAAITNLFPEEGSIYATNFNLRENMAGQISGRATSNQQILALLDRMKDDKHFASPKLMDMRETGQSTREVAFTITFEYRPVE